MSGLDDLDVFFVVFVVLDATSPTLPLTPTTCSVRCEPLGRTGPRQARLRRNMLPVPTAAPSPTVTKPARARPD
eukprot:618703-Prorocentrum_minimum.AAC.1